MKSILQHINKLTYFAVFFLAVLANAQNTQNNGNAKVITAGETTSANGKFYINAGIPILGINVNQVRTTTPADVRFPWHILYKYSTFADESFWISKGYYADKVIINWLIRSNQDQIQGIKIFRRKLGETNYVLIASVGAGITEYEDKYIEGNVLYEYKVAAEGIIKAEQKYLTFIDGIGFRVPMGIVTGRVSFAGGNPVQDVVLNVSSQSGTSYHGNAVYVADNASIRIKSMKDGVINDYLTVQSWVKPKTSFTNAGDPIKLFSLANSTQSETIEATAKLITGTENYIEVIFKNGSTTSIYKLKNYYPSGQINARSNDILIPVTRFNSEFIHFSLCINSGVPLLYINGRKMTEAYAQQAHANLLDKDTNYTAPYFSVEVPTTAIVINNAYSWQDIVFGKQKGMLLDEVRIWDKALTEDVVYNDFKRLIDGNNNSLLCYLRFDEGKGDVAYDLSHFGFDYNQNEGHYYDANDKVQTPLWAFDADTPKADQFGILGVTDVNGNYVISAIPYAGAGESISVTPILGVHKFDPKQQLVYIGENSPVVNSVNFTDISSFTLRGKVLFDSRNIFKSFVQVNSPDPNTPNFANLTDGDEYVSGPGIIDEGYNYYEKNNQKYSKGEYWLNNNNTPADNTDDYLERYARIPAEGINIYIDDKIFLDRNNTPVATDSDGNFEISVPIGNHYITVKQNGHVFKFDGRFPADKTELQEFFQNIDEQVVFIDETKVDVVGRVVGGSVESQKVIGFGDNGAYSKQVTDANGYTTTEVVSSVNNIGVANITFDFTPAGGNPTAYTKATISTNTETGEYRTKMLPLLYSISQTGGIRIASNPTLQVLTANETVDYKNILDPKTPEYTYKDGVKITGTPYQYNTSFTYRVTPVLRVIDQNSEKALAFGDKTISTEGFQYKIYKQFATYKINLQRFEPYVNYDASTTGKEFIVPVTDGEFKITNNLALSKTESIVVDPKDQSKVTYTFKGGLPSKNSPYTRTLSLKYRINGVDYEAQNYETLGIVLGGQSDGSQTFVTSAPDSPDIILRDPPGSNSSATIEKGQVITLSSESEVVTEGGTETETTLLLGVTFAAGGGLAGPVIETQTTNDVKAGIALSSSSKDGKSLTKTYTFNQSISTSDDPGTVGADGDLYIGQSKNYFYGSYDEIKATDTPKNNSFQLTNSAGESIYISTQKAVYFSEEPSDTFFVFSQTYIVNTLIPEYQGFIDGLNDGSISPNTPGVLTKEQYEQQINQWRSTIRENERVKYLAKNDRDTYKNTLTTKVDDYIKELTDAIKQGNDPASETTLSNNLDNANVLKDIVNKQFFNNISFDSNVGSINREIETNTVNTTSKSINLTVDTKFALDLGFKLNGFGLLVETSGYVSHSIDTSISKEEGTSTSISYNFADTNPNDLFSVDVVNAFDGNGPIFIKRGGRTTCPYEGISKSLYYNHGTYVLKDDNIIDLAEADQEDLDFATQRIDVPSITADVLDITNVPEGNKAEYRLTLENVGVLQGKTLSDFTLRVNPTTNQNNAIINIPTSGLKYTFFDGKPIQFVLTIEKGTSDVYDYEDIEIIFESDCNSSLNQDELSASILVSAHFVPSCSGVAVSAPLTNFVYNISEAYNLDGTTNALPISISSYNVNFKSFEKIDLEYRSTGSSTWTRLHTYYGAQADFDAAKTRNETEVSLINGATVTYPWDIVGRKIQNGNYEIRAVSKCKNNTSTISTVISGKIDIIAPQVFGTPTPTDGILSYGEDISVRFNEPIFYNSSTSLIEIKGETNQLPVNNDVSLYFSGSSNSATIEKPYIKSGDFSFEFWMNNATPAGTNAAVVSQKDGFNISVNGSMMTFKFGDDSVSGTISTDGLFHHYTFVYKSDTGAISVYQDGTVVVTANKTINLQYNFTNPIIFGGSAFVGNIHDVRLWSKALSFADAFANIYTKYQGNELNLIGYWPMNEGNGIIAADKASYKNAVVNTSWDIKPKGNAYDFANGQYLTLNSVSAVQLSDQSNATLSFWVKTGVTQNATIFSNGRGDNTDIIAANGTYNKWAVNLNNDGNLYFMSENTALPLTTASITDDQWHHVSILLNRQGNLRTYVDAKLVSTNATTTIKGFYGDRIWLGARGHVDLAGVIQVDRPFTGKLDEVRFWNTLRTFEQIDRDRYFEVDTDSPGLLVYTRFTEPNPTTGAGPRYYNVVPGPLNSNAIAAISNGAVKYTNDTPPIKPARATVKFQVNYVINGDQMIIEPIVSSLALIEGQILDITVHRMYDGVNNVQESPVTWTAYINKDQLKWYIEGKDDIVQSEIESGTSKTYTILIVNSGGTLQDYNIKNIPSWLKINNSKGTLNPNSSIELTATVDSELASGNYIQDLFLETALGFDQKIQLDLNVASSIDWTVNPNDFKYSMNVIAKVKVDGVFDTDTRDKIGVFYNGEVRGVGSLVYDPIYQEYFVYLTIYSNEVANEEMNFSIWDSSSNKILSATLNGDETVQFTTDKVIGSKSTPAIIENNGNVGQSIALNQGFTWVSFYVKGNNFNNVNAVTKKLNLENDDLILSNTPALLDSYYKDVQNPANSSWSGGVTLNGGFSIFKMYKVRLSSKQTLEVSGTPVDLKTWSFPILQNWNWLPFVVDKNVRVNDALANYQPTENDVIKSQDKFAIYDAKSGWSGTLTYLERGRGYMIKSGKAQTFTYPSYLGISTGKSGKYKGAENESNNIGDNNIGEFSKYSANMNAIIKLPSGYETVYAYDKNGTLKGVSSTQAINGKALAFMTIFGETSETEELQFYISKNGEDKKKTSKTTGFKADLLLGTISQPFVIDEDLLSQEQATVKMYPNPVETGHDVYLKCTANNAQNAQIIIHNLIGQAVYQSEVSIVKGVNQITIPIQLQSGVYTVSISIDNALIANRLIVK